jgi:predicted nucleic acid-binding protein
VATVTLLELGFFARSTVHWRDLIGKPPVTRLLIETLTPAVEDRAVEVQGLLAERGHHRAAKIPDLLIAAIAERVGLHVLHVDKDFDLTRAPRCASTSC